jgi:hypothetical protein
VRVPKTLHTSREVLIRPKQPTEPVDSSDIADFGGWAVGEWSGSGLVEGAVPVVMAFVRAQHGRGVALAGVACRRGRGGVEPAPARMLVLVRRGCFARSANGVVSVLDPTVACLVNPGE